MTQLEELQIIEQVIQGDADAFEALVTENQSFVYNLAFKMCRSEQDALDISQEVFVKAYTNLRSFRCDSRFSVWLYRLTYNMCIDLLRKKKRTPVTSLSREDPEEETAELLIPDTAAMPEQVLERKELCRSVNRALDELKPEYKKILLMRLVAEMQYEEIASALYLNVGTVKSRLSRARQALVKILIKNGTFSETDRQTSERGQKE